MMARPEQDTGGLAGINLEAEVLKYVDDDSNVIAMALLRFSAT